MIPHRIPSRSLSLVSRPLLPQPIFASRSKKKREVRAAFERRAIREALEKKIREVLRTPPSDRTPEQLELLREHASVVAPLMANLERSLRRKTQTEERLEEREAGERGA